MVWRRSGECWFAGWYMNPASGPFVTTLDVALDDTELLRRGRHAVTVTAGRRGVGRCGLLERLPLPVVRRQPSHSAASAGGGWVGEACAGIGHGGGGGGASARRPRLRLIRDVLPPASSHYVFAGQRHCLHFTGLFCSDGSTSPIKHIRPSHAVIVTPRYRRIYQLPVAARLDGRCSLIIANVQHAPRMTESVIIRYPHLITDAGLPRRYQPSASPPALHQAPAATSRQPACKCCYARPP